MRWCACALAVLLSLGAGAGERIDSFHSGIKISEQGELSVTETIQVLVDGNRIKRGILRDFPTEYRDRFGRRVRVPFDLIGVRRDGRVEPAVVQAWGNGVRVQIGNAAVLLPHGRHVYEIRYRTRYQLGFFDDHDELYWNATGNGWVFDMDRVSADVSLPRGVDPEQLRAEAYTGKLGAKGRDYTAHVRSGGAYFSTTKALAPGEGLTIVFSFPKGIVAAPGWRDRMARALHDNQGEAAGAAGGLLLLVFFCWRWWAAGRDPRKGPVFPRYQAPAGLGPAGTRYLDRMQCDDRCFAAALLGLGQRGYLTIRHAGEAYTIDGTGRRVEWLPGEEALAQLVPEPGTGGVAIGAGYNPLVKKARDALETSLAAYYGKKLFSRNQGSFFIGVLIASCTMAAMFFLDVATTVLIGGGIAMAVMLFLFSRLLPAYTAEGRKLEDEVEGLRQYLSIAEKDDLARLKLPPRTAEEFAKFLPYALALGVEQTWANAFASVLGAAGVAQAVASYYQSDSLSPDGNIGGLMSDSFADFGRSISAASMPPGSSSGSSGGGGDSGGGGGGSSGGGGGGGGGSGW